MVTTYIAEDRKKWIEKDIEKMKKYVEECNINAINTTFEIGIKLGD